MSNPRSVFRSAFLRPGMLAAVAALSMVMAGACSSSSNDTPEGKIIIGNETGVTPVPDGSTSDGSSVETGGGTCQYPFDPTRVPPHDGVEPNDKG